MSRTRCEDSDVGANPASRMLLENATVTWVASVASKRSAIAAAEVDERPTVATVAAMPRAMPIAVIQVRMERPRRDWIAS